MTRREKLIKQIVMRSPVYAEELADEIIAYEQEIIEKITKPLREYKELGGIAECQECGGRGWYAQQVSDTEQEQRRCECCNDGKIEVDVELFIDEALKIAEELK